MWQLYLETKFGMARKLSVDNAGSKIVFVYAPLKTLKKWRHLAGPFVQMEPEKEPLQMYFVSRTRGCETGYKPTCKPFLSNTIRDDINDLPIIAAFLISNSQLNCSKVTPCSLHNCQYQIGIKCRNCNVKVFHIRFPADASNFEIAVVQTCEHVTWTVEWARGAGMGVYWTDCSPTWAQVKARCPFGPNEVPLSLRRIVRRLTRPPIHLPALEAQFCDYIVFNRWTEKRHVQIANHTVGLEDFFANTDGFKQLYVIPGDDRHLGHLHRINGEPLVAAVWVAPWAISALLSAQYLELDGSFTALDPFVYNVPQAIVKNNAVPVGFSMGPSESGKLFEIFRIALIEYGMPEHRFRVLPVLSDEGSALKKYSELYHEYHFYCYCHLIRKFGAGTPAALIAQRVLYCSSLAEFQAELPQFASDLRVQLDKCIIDEDSYAGLCNFIGFEREDTLNPKMITGYPSDFVHGIWHRQEFGVSTCDNHAERFHGVLNKACDTRSSLAERLGIAHHEICKKFAKYMSDPNAQAKKHFRQLQKTSSSKLDECPTKCGWSDILSIRYGTSFPFPCPHVHVPSEMTIEFNELPPIACGGDVPVIIPPMTQNEQKMMAKWLKKILPRPSEANDRIKWTASDQNVAEFPGRPDWMAFVRQIAAELRSLGQRVTHWEDLLIKVTAEYLQKCNEWGQNPAACDTEAKAGFRAMLIEPLLPK
jgi:hypothetical protein